MALNELSAALWRERRLLELLLFKLDEQRLVLVDGRTQWLEYTTDEIESVLEKVRGAELGVAVEVQDAALALDLDPDCSLADLAEAAPAPWDDLLHDHRRAVVGLVEEIRALRETNSGLLTTSHRSVQEALTALEDAVGTDDATDDATDGPADGSAHVLDRTR
ncbi:flagellar export chaperone FlgN [Actinotalea sp. Marseille-Q4924]|uniref:flagellar export chaperone FlgN n=1 Tax=Actinotalea sp. Marseille-Q4924 TaxID=2866571 RepID=UPI001CE41DE1|nr:flagellar export chaperone FlgN [Actinotalea sp. Marseille-Q4924]